MIVRSLEINEALQMTPIAPDDALKACQVKGARVWIDLQGPERGELEEWLERLDVSGLARKLCIEAHDRSGFYPLRNEILLVIPALAESEAALEVDYAAFLCKEGVLLTFHGKPVLGRQHLSTADESDAWLSERSIAGLVSAVMIDLSMNCLHHAASLRDSIIALEMRMDRGPETVEAEEILDLRSELLVLETVVTDQQPALKSLSAIDRPFFKLKDSRDYMNCALTNLQAVDGATGRLDRRVVDLYSGLQMYAQDKTNRRLGMLTILSAIFMPITLLAGIWGMNFENMPELSVPFGYPMAIGLMTLIGAGMYLFFRRTGWFG